MTFENIFCFHLPDIHWASSVMHTGSPLGVEGGGRDSFPKFHGWEHDLRLNFRTSVWTIRKRHVLLTLGVCEDSMPIKTVGGYFACLPEHMNDTHANTTNDTWLLGFFFFFFWLPHVPCGILVPRPGIEPAPLAMKAWSPNHCTTRKFPWMTDTQC